MVLSDIEFFTYESEVWLRKSSGDTRILSETDKDVINALIHHISTFYPKAFAALESEYQNCSPNQSYFRFRMAVRFIRCNFAALDSIPDFNTSHVCTFEHVNCPLRGECRYDHVICRPSFDHRLSPAEMRVMELVYRGLTEEEVGSRLCLSPLTVHTHVRNAYTRLGIHSKAEFVKYAANHHLFS